MSKTYTEANTNGWRDLPGPGDEATWGPCRNHPGDPRTPEAIEDTDAFALVQIEMRQKRINDINGYFLESLTEADDEVLKSIADAVETEDELLVGRLVVQQVRAYCTPSDEDVIEEMNKWDGGF